MVPPEMPTGGSIGQVVLGHQSHGQTHDAMGVLAVGGGQIAGVGLEVMAAVPAVMLGKLHLQFTGAGQKRIAQIVQLALAAS